MGMKVRAGRFDERGREQKDEEKVGDEVRRKKGKTKRGGRGNLAKHRLWLITCR